MNGAGRISTERRRSPDARSVRVVEFDDEAAATAWFDSPEYAELRRFREKGGTAHHLLVRTDRSDG